MKAWNDLLDILANKFGKETVDTWLRPLKVVKFDAGNLYLYATSTFQLHWFREYVTPYLDKHLLTASGRVIKVHLSIEGKEPSSPKKEGALTDEYQADPLESYATFEGFIPSSDPHLPYLTLSQLADGSLPLGHYNPIYIYGPKGSGKSHLLMSTAKSLKEQGKRCFFVRANTFTNHVIWAFRSTSLHAFRSTYRNIDVLIIDDVHLLSGKIATQEELFHTFNRLHTKGVQIILAAECSPRLLEQIEERLISRFEWGLTLPVSFPNQALCLKILELRAHYLNIPLNLPLKTFLIESFKNPQTLIQALETLALHLPQTSVPTDLEIVKYYLKNLLIKESATSLTPEKILKIVANTCGITVEDILGKGQNRECALPRQIAMYLCREKLRLPYLKIGRLFFRDHSTVITSVKRVKAAAKQKEKAFISPLRDIQQLFFKSFS